MMENDQNQQKIMELVVDKVLKKHGVIDEKPNLDLAEKEKIAEIVQNIKADVEKFLENANKTKTEHDFQTNTEAPVMEQQHQQQQPVMKSKKTFTSNNDVAAVKTFFKK